LVSSKNALQVIENYFETGFSGCNFVIERKKQLFQCELKSKIKNNQKLLSL